MHVAKIRIKNLKTFDDICLNLNKFNVLVGKSGSGKTNFIEILELFKDISYDFHNAIKKHGGKYLKNLNKNSNESMMKIEFGNVNKRVKLDSGNILLVFRGVDYEISFKFLENNCKVLNETVRLNCEVINSENQKRKTNKIIIENNNGKISINFLKDMKDLKISEIIPDNLVSFVQQDFKNDNTPIINSPLSFLPIRWGDLFKKISAYDFDVNSLKNMNPTSDEKLTKDGRNMPKVLKRILNDEKSKKEFLIYYTNLMPYIKDVSFEKILGEERVFMIREKYSDVKIPSQFISSSSLRVMAMIIAVCFEEGEILLIEEPERHIHPSLICQLVFMMESSGKQIIITSNSTEILKYSELENIVLITRDGNGFSDIDRISDDVKPFIDNLGIESVFANDFLDLKEDN